MSGPDQRLSVVNSIFENQIRAAQSAYFRNFEYAQIDAERFNSPPEAQLKMMVRLGIQKSRTTNLSSNDIARCAMSALFAELDINEEDLKKAIYDAGVEGVHERKDSDEAF